MSKLHLECKPDEALAFCLGFTRKQVKHHGAKGNVCNYLEDSEQMTAMMDEDPNSFQPGYLGELIEIEMKHRLRHLIDNRRQHNVVLVCPKLEDWIIDVAKKSQVSPKQFGLPDSPNDLHRVINSRLEQFKRLIDHLLDIEAEPILHLKRLLTT